jgi:hypothetical protein
VVPWLRAEEYNYTAYYAILATLAAARSLWTRREFRFDWATAFFAWLTVVAVAGVLLHGDVSEYVTVVVPLAATSTYMVFKHAEPNEAGEMLLVGVTVLVMVESAIGLSQTFFGQPEFALLADTLNQAPRNYLALVLPGLPQSVRQATGTFNHFNALGGLLSLTAPPLVGRWVERPGSLPRAAVALAALAATVASFSRGALLGVTVGVVILYAQRTKGSRTVLRYALVGAAATAAVLLLSERIASYWATTENLGIRARTWAAAWSVASRDPWRLALGYGLRYFDESVVGGVGGVVRLHSAPLQVALESGAAGIGLLVLAAARTWRAVLRFDSLAGLGVAAGVFGFLVHQLLDNSLFDYPAILLAAMWAVACAHFDAVREEQAASRSSE